MGIVGGATTTEVGEVQTLIEHEVSFGHRHHRVIAGVLEEEVGLGVQAILP